MTGLRITPIQEVPKVTFILGRFSRLAHGLVDRENIYLTSRNSKVMDFQEVMELKSLKSFSFQQKYAKKFLKSLWNEMYWPDLNNFFAAIEFNVFRINITMMLG